MTQFRLSKTIKDPGRSRETTVSRDPPAPWWSRSGSNRRPPPCKGGALPAELLPRFAHQPTVVGLSGLEPLTSRLSGVRSSQLSYRPWQRTTRGSLKTGSSVPDRSTSVEATVIRWLGSVRKEVIQPQVLLRLPCYDFTPIADHTFDSYLPVKGWPTGFWCNRLS